MEGYNQELVDSVEKLYAESDLALHALWSQVVDQIRTNPPE